MPACTHLRYNDWRLSKVQATRRNYHAMYTSRLFSPGTAATLALGQAAWASDRRPRIAALTTIYHKYSHSQHIIDRFLEGYGWEGRHHRPAMDVVALYVEQVGNNDLSRERARRHSQMKIYPTIAEALTLGGSKLAVDGVLLIGEHGSYPVNEKRANPLPRVMNTSNRSSTCIAAAAGPRPLFNDKHLSWNWDYARQMVDTAQEMGFGFMAGSSLPVTWRQPSHDLPWAAEVEEAVGIWGGGHRRRGHPRARSHAIHCRTAPWRRDGGAGC